jgi:hypothetical protein
MAIYVPDRVPIAFVDLYSDNERLPFILIEALIPYVGVLPGESAPFTKAYAYIKNLLRL